jgi:hypothetical protein
VYHGLVGQSFPKPKSADSIPIYRVMVAGINCPAVVLVPQQALIYLNDNPLRAIGLLAAVHFEPTAVKRKPPP